MKQDVWLFADINGFSPLWMIQIAMRWGMSPTHRHSKFPLGADAKTMGVFASLLLQQCVWCFLVDIVEGEKIILPLFAEDLIITKGTFIACQQVLTSSALGSTGTCM